MATSFIGHDQNVHEEVDFMTMFTNQNDDSNHSSLPQQPHPPHYVAQPTLPATDPLQVFDNNMNVTPTQTPVTATPTDGWAQVPPMHPGMMPVAYPQPVADVYSAGGLGQPFVPMAAPQYVEPSLAMPHRPTTAPASAAPTMPFSVFNAGVSPSTPAAPRPVVTSTSPSGSHRTSSPTSAHTSPIADSSNTGEKSQVRRKRKLTPEDKRRICEIYRNSQGKIRQEDIAKEYSVDRSTISKILNQEERWLEGDSANNMGLNRRPGGRYPAIEEEMHRWLDEAVMAGREVRDSEAREEALKIGIRLGHPSFQASSKWWDGVKRRRIEEGRAMPTMRRPQSAISPPMVMPAGLVRSYSAMTMVDSMPREVFPMGPNYQMVDGGMVPIMPLHIQTIPLAAARARSQSSPQMPGFVAQQAPSFGPQRTSPVTPLSRHRSYHSGAGSPSRPSPLHRPTTSQGTAPRPSPHQRLGASALGITPARPEASPVEHPIDRPSTAPSMSPLSITVSDSDNAAMGLSPSTPRTPAQATFMPQQPEHMELPGQIPCGGYDGTNMVPVYPVQPGCQPMTHYPQPVYAGMEYVQPQW